MIQRSPERRRIRRLAARIADGVHIEQRLGSIERTVARRA